MSEFVRIKQARSGRYAVMIRCNADTPWVQVESCMSEAMAQLYVEDAGLDDDEGLRAYEIAATEEDGEQPDWGDDAPRA